MSYHGTPCWYELGTSDLKAAVNFYGAILGWDVADSGMAVFEYHLAKSDDDMVAGMMSNARQHGNPAPNWLIHFAVNDCDKAAADIKAAGGQIYKEPNDIPGTGRFAVVADPQGAVFGVLQPDMSQMSAPQRTRAEQGGAFNQNKSGHGNWNELMSTDPQAAFAFYSRLFGWSKGEAMNMGAMGVYQLLHHRGPRHWSHHGARRCTCAGVVALFRC